MTRNEQQMYKDISELTFTDTYDLVEAIMRNIEKQFKIKDD